MFMPPHPHCRVEQIAQPDKVVGDRLQAKHRTHLASAAQLELAQAAPLLDQAQHHLDAASGVDQLGEAHVAGGASIDGGTTSAGGVLRHVGRDADPAHVSDNAHGVGVLGTDGLLVGTGDVSRHRYDSIPLSGAHRLVPRQSTIKACRFSMTWPPVPGQGSMGLVFATQQGVGIDGGAVGLVLRLMPR
jgi:hypothetical protein